MACTPSRAERATRVTVVSNGSSRASMASPIAPYPTISTDLSARAGRHRGFHSRRSWARTNSGMPRSDDRIRVSVSSAVELSWMPRPLHRVTPSGICERTLSTPADSVCTTSRLDHPGQHVGDAAPPRRTASRRTRPRTPTPAPPWSDRPPRSGASVGGSPSSAGSNGSQTSRSGHGTSLSCHASALASVSEATWSITARNRPASSAAAAQSSANGRSSASGRPRDQGLDQLRDRPRAAAPSATTRSSARIT